MTYHFLSTPGEWTGTGCISFSKIEETIPFTVTWHIEPFENKRIRAIQKIHVEGEEPNTNSYIINPVSNGTFELFFENKELGVFSGKGVCSEEHIAWEFAHFGVFEGLEVYQKKSSDIYEFTAQYTGGEDYTTKIAGKLYKTVIPQRV